jgi:L-tyrosine isonitrile synthase
LRTGIAAVADEARLSSSTSSLRKYPSSDHVKKIVQSFNTWAFKREQPSDLGLLTRFTTRAVMRQEPLSFVLYWGKGPRSDIESYDLQCLDYLGTMAARVQGAYGRGAAFSLVLTDTHATLNGHPAQQITNYFAQVEQEAGRRGFDSYLLSELTQAAGRSVRMLESQPSEETLQQLVRSAMRWYRGEGTPEEGAKRYYDMNMVEKQVIELFFPSSVFVTFNGREHRDLFPDKLPIFFMYSLKRGTSVKPWFLPEPLLPQATALAS